MNNNVPNSVMKNLVALVKKRIIPCNPAYHIVYFSFSQREFPIQKSEIIFVKAYLKHFKTLQ